MNAFDIIKKEFGTDRLRINPVRDIAFTTTSAKVLPRNQNRVYLLLINPNINNAYINFNKKVSSTDGIPILADGDGLILSVKEDMNLVCEEVHGIINTSAGDLIIIEIEVY